LATTQMKKENSKSKETQSDEEEWQTFMKNLWDKISPQYRGYLVGLFLFLLVVWSMWSVWDKTSH
jgi:type II secretory pathway component PulM